MNRALSYICSDVDLDLQKKISYQNKTPILIQANPNPNSKRRQSLLNPLPVSLILDKKSKSAVKRMSMTTEVTQNQPKLLVENTENLYDFYNVQTGKSTSGYGSPQKLSRVNSINNKNYSTNKINIFNPHEYFDIDM